VAAQTQVAYFMNGQAAGSFNFTAYLPDLTAAGIVMGTNRYPQMDNAFVGNFAEVLVYLGVLSNSDRLAIESYLTTKYNI
jgi:hypothetical protein